MAMQEGNGAHTPSAQVVGNAFVEQYYHILHQSPNLVHRFYQDSSHLSRPDMYGNMTTVTTMQVSLLGVKRTSNINMHEHIVMKNSKYMASFLFTLVIPVCLNPALYLRSSS